MTNVITICIDESCEMACVELNDQCVMMGDYLDHDRYRHDLFSRHQLKVKYYSEQE